MMNLSYRGEFGPELTTVLPYAYYLSKNGSLGKTIGSLDTKCFYYFSKEHEELYHTREYLSPDHPERSCLPNPSEHKFKLLTTQFIPPPYKQIYANRRFVWRKEPLVIMNKFNQEWEGLPRTYLNLTVLKTIIEWLKGDYQIIYSRPLPFEIIGDNSQILRLGDYDLVAAYSDVVSIQQLHQSNPDLTFNTLQLMVYANCNKFISLQGGTSVLASYFAEHNIIYALAGQELARGDFNNYSLFNRARICPCLNEKDLLNCVRKMYCQRSRGNFVGKDMVPAVQMMKYFLSLVIRKIRPLLGAIKQWLCPQSFNRKKL